MGQLEYPQRRRMNMPTQGRRKAWQWLVGWVLAALYGLTASPASFAQIRIVCQDNDKFPTFIIQEKAERPTSQCQISESPEVNKVEVEVKSTIVDCGLELTPSPKGDQLKATLKDCAHVVLENGLTKVFMVDVADVKPATLLLNQCAPSTMKTLPGCPEILNAWSEQQKDEDFEAFKKFQASGKYPERVRLQQPDECDETFDALCNQLVLRYDLSESKICGTSSGTSSGVFVAVIGHLRADTKAIAEDRSKLEVSRAFIRGVVQCP